MRHRGRRRPIREEKIYFNQYNNPENKFNKKNLMKIPKMTQTNQNFTYVGRCRCGYGPNAYYKTTDGEIISTRQLIQTSPMKQKPPNNLSISSSPTEMFSPKIEVYRICNRCGAQVRADALFCTECGNEIGELQFSTKKEQIELIKTRIKDLKNQLKIIKRNA